MTTNTKKKATIGAIAILLLFGLAFGFALPSSALAWDDCPKGLVNDPYPGACSRYVDTNGDGICDLSQPEPTASTTTLATVATATTETTAGQASDDGTQSAAAAGTATLVAATGSATTSTTAPSSGASSDPATVATSTTGATTVAAAVVGASSESSFLTHYLVSPIAIGFFLIYAVSFILYKTRRIRVATHRKIWNVLLLLTFLITGVFGLLLAIQLDYTLPFTIPIDMLFWHVEAGIVMTLISLFHMGWHFNYYRGLLRTGRNKARAARQAERLRTIEDRRLATEMRGHRRTERARSTEGRQPVWEVQD